MSLTSLGVWPELRRRVTAPTGWFFLLAIVLRAVAALRIDPVTWDSALYFEMANLIGANRWSGALAYDYPPLYPILIASVQLLGISVQTAGLVVSLGADLLTLFPLVAIARRAAGEAAASGAAFLWAVHPAAIRLGVQALTDAPTVAVMALALWAGLRALEQCRLIWALGAGAASGLAYLLRPEGMEVALALTCVYALRGGKAARSADEASPSVHSFPWAKRQGLGKRALRKAAWVVAPLAGWTIVASPYLAYISVERGSVTLSKKQSTLALLGSLRSLSKEGARGIAGRAFVFQKRLVKGVNRFIIFFGVLGFWVSRSWKPGGSRRVRALLIGLLGLHLTLLFGVAADRGVAYLDGRHFFPMVLYILPFSGAGLSWTLTWATDRLRVPLWVTVVALALLFGVSVVRTLTPRPGREVSVRQAAAWIRSQVAGTPVIVTNVAKLTHHAGAERIVMDGSYDDILHRAREQSAHFLAFYPDSFPEVSSDFLARIDKADLELARSFPVLFASAPGQRLDVYRLRPK